MMRRLFLIGMLLFVPLQAGAASLFENIFEEAKTVRPSVYPSEKVMDFIIGEMVLWGETGIVLTREDILAAMDGRTWTPDGSGLCQNKKDPSGRPYVFAQGAPLTGGSCLDLQEAIRTLVRFEAEVLELGNDLLAIAHGAELGVADEPHRPLSMATLALLLRQVWSGTGSAVVPWDGTAESKLTALDTLLQNTDLPSVVYRYHHGYFRDKRENDPRFASMDPAVGEALNALAVALKISGKPSSTGEFVIPQFKNTKNVGVWARADDIGLLWIYPLQWTRFEIRPAKEYPVLVRGGEALAYPFSYRGTRPPDPTGNRTPLCARTIGRQGYLCRDLPPIAADCTDPHLPNTISLLKCSDPRTEVRETVVGPEICPGFDKIYTDTGEPFYDPKNPGNINPEILRRKANLRELCTPTNSVLYQDDIASHSCFIARCVLQSLSGHTLMAGRSPVVTGEATSPYLACIRPDPRLGSFVEQVDTAPYPLPPYNGHILVQDFDRLYCAKNGLPPQALAGLCAYRDTTRGAIPDSRQIFHMAFTTWVTNSVMTREQNMNAVATAIGQRAALDQTLELNRKVLARVTNFITQVSNLFLELKKAPLTLTPCPWTGPFRSP